VSARRSGLPLAAALALGCAQAGGVLTQHNDNARTGAMLAETILGNGNVDVGHFGRVARLPVRGSIFVQPLAVPEVAVAGGRRDLVVVATMHNAVYAFAGDGTPTLVWGPVSLGPAIPLPDPEIGPEGYKDIYGEVGVMSTPVISLTRNSLYVQAATKEGGRFVHRLHRLDLGTGQPQRPAVEIAAPGFDSRRQSQRSALLLSHDTVYVSFASYGDRCPYRGWMFAYDADTLAPRAVFSSSDGEGVGLWMGGQGPAADEAGDVYALTSNRIEDRALCPVRHPVNLSNSILRLRGDTLTVASSFTPANNARLNDEDGDLGGAGALLIPGSNLLLGAGKEARVFLVDRTSMGGFDPARDDRQPGVVQRFFANRERCPKGKLGGPDCHHIHSAPVFWKGPMGSWIYVWPENDFLEAFRYDPAAGRIDCRGAADPDCDPISRSTTMDPENIPGGAHGMPGGFLSISANGSQAGTGLVWAFHPYTGNANQKLVDGVLRVYDASDLTRERWNSRQNVDRDDLGPYPKFTWPTVAHGRVYAPTFSALTGRVLLDALSEAGPALAAGLGGRMFVAWTGMDTRLNLASSRNGRTMTEKIVLDDRSPRGPALAADDGLLYLGWVGVDGRLNVGRTAALAAGFTRMGEVVGGNPAWGLAATTEAAPALAVGGGRVVLAFRGADQRIGLMWAATGATAFAERDRVTLAEQTLGAPALAFVEGRLLLSWTGTDRRLNVAEVASDGALGARRTLQESSAAGPALVGRRSSGGAAADLHLFWAGTDDRTRLNVVTADDGVAFASRLTLDDQTSERPAATLYDGRLFVAFRGNDAAHHLTLARYNPGELSVYGLLGLLGAPAP
jgi:hypothetical protein